MNRIFLVAMTVVLAALTAPGAPRGKAPAASKAKPPAALKVKSGNYTPGGKLTRREFVEKTFGVKFGDKLDKYIAHNAATDTAGWSVNTRSRQLASPVCGRKEVMFFMSRSGELESIHFGPTRMPKREANLKAVKARLDKFSKEVGKWLGIKAFELQETTKGTCNVFARVFEENGLRVEATVECAADDKGVMGYDCSLTIMIDDSAAKVITDVEAAAQEEQADSGNPPPAPDPEEKKARAERQQWEAGTEATKARMKKIILPSVRFGPPATIVDAVDFLRFASKQHDDPKLPPERRGLNFILRAPPGGTKFMELPQIDEADISLWDALGKVCASCGWKFTVDGALVFVMPKGSTSEQLLTRGIHVDEAALDSKAGTAGIKDFGAKTAKWKSWLESQGVDWPDGSRMMYIPSVGTLRVTNTEDNLDKIENIMAK